jgi:hypothetical protein
MYTTIMQGVQGGNIDGAWQPLLLDKVKTHRNARFDTIYYCPKLILKIFP